MKLSNVFAACLFVTGVISIALMAVPHAHAQMAISNDGVTFPDDTEQTSAVIVPTDCPHSESIVWDSNIEAWVCASDLSPILYALGDTGPAGGTVFYVTDGGQHGLEAAPDEQGIARWGCSGPLAIAGADGTEIGTGAQNSIDILIGCQEFNAVRVTDFYSLNGFRDWFLPSKDELNQLYLQRATVGGIADGTYWSSSESSTLTAHFQTFPSGLQGDSNKDNWARVRAIRAF